MNAYPAYRTPPTLPGGRTAVLSMHGGWNVLDHQGRLVGVANPWVLGDPDGHWYGKRAGKDATPKGVGFGEVQALAYVCGCQPAEIRFEEAGRG